MKLGNTIWNNKRPRHSSQRFVFFIQHPVHLLQEKVDKKLRV
jgi:hypothetical protein